jgi:aromatic-amino-acid transaminase
VSFFASVEMAQGDPILGLTETYLADPRPGKINLGVGIYIDEQRRFGTEQQLLGQLVVRRQAG